MDSNEIRSAFLKFFEGKQHKVIPSSSLVPKGDPTLLLTTAGMVQVKPYFMGEAVPPSPRLASCQKCFRTTDIESVGDATHLTFFEMLGNFSVGDYFKKEAIAWAWEFVTEWMKLPPNRLWVTIFLDDDESFGYWREIGVPAEKIVRCDEKDNFWGPAGNSGPCGPCSEIHYDFGENADCRNPDCQPNCDCGRFVEVWNLVFTQYNQDEAGNRTPLPKPNIDTGMGLERLLTVMAGKDTIYETDLFTPLLESVSALCGKKYGVDDEADYAMRVIAEHGRALAFLIADGVMPDNEGRGYVLRRLLRRAALFGRRLGLEKPFLTGVARTAIGKMGKLYPELQQRQDFIIRVIEQEETRFGETLSTGLEVLSRELSQMGEKVYRVAEVLGEKFDNVIATSEYKQAIENFRRFFEGIGEGFIKFLSSPELSRATQLLTEQLQKIPPEVIAQEPSTEVQKLIQHNLEFPGADAFRLYDTYGFPVELTKEIVSQAGFNVDMDGFEREMEKQRERARASHKFDVAKSGASITNPYILNTDFVGYKNMEQEAKIALLLVAGEEANTISEGQSASIILNTTPFYGEMGGQLGDTGEIIGTKGVFQVTDTIRGINDTGVIIHEGKVTQGTLSLNEEVEAVVDVDRRRDIARNHTATHLLHLALRRVLGDHVQQRGSLVAPERLRFDFSHLSAVKPEELREIQHIVNKSIRRNLRVYDEESSYQEAVGAGVIALFDEKYGDVVRVLKIGEPAVSAELCGGTHVAATGELGYFQIVSEGSIGAGLRRIEAVTGRGAEELLERRLASLEDVAESLQADMDDIADKAYALSNELEKERKRALALEKELARQEAEALLGKAESVNGVSVLAAKVSTGNQEVLREMADFIRDRLKSVIIVLGAVSGDRPLFISSVTPDLVEKGYSAGDIVKKVAAVAGGGGGGKAAFAQGSGKNKDKLDEALALVKTLM